MAVYTEIDDQTLSAFIADYDIGELVSYKGIAEGVENSNYLLVTSLGPYILTLYEKRVNPADLPFFLGLMDHLAGNGLACPTPVAARDGEALRELCGRPAAIVTFLRGMWPRKIQAHHCAQLGTALARMHLAGEGFTLTRHNALSVDGWRPLFEAARPRADEVMPGLADEIARELDLLEARWPTDLPHGVIHADAFPDNVFYLNDQFSGLIDFYFACNDLLAYDVAVCLNAWCFEADRSFNATKARLLLASYRKVRPFEDAELNALPLLCRGSAMRFLLTRLYDWLNTPAGAFVKPKDPMEYLHKLRFHAAVSGPGAYGLE
ncbi:homoserine kinase [Insolitispirillum peregrinum]|uniref:homoserine kinase n=1 Tax=Insolitispirillum peregrinum TaxID=80876 RepID=UPI003619BDFE